MYAGSTRGQNPVSVQSVFYELLRYFGYYGTGEYINMCHHVIIIIYVIQDILAEGYSSSQIISQLFDQLVNHSEINDHQKSEIAERLAVSVVLAVDAITQ